MLVSKLAYLLLAFTALSLTACSMTSEKATTLPFDLASTTADGATSVSSSGGDDTQAALDDQRRFVRQEIDWIRRDAAVGAGERLAALGILLGEADVAAFSAWAHAEYDSLFVGLSAPEELLTRIATLRGHG